MGRKCSMCGGEGVLVGKPEGKRPFGRLRLRWRIILRCIFRKWDVWAWNGFIWLRIGASG